jgi:hypothetical protein
MSNTLVEPGQLSGLPGSPFTDLEVDMAVATLRADVGWHIAPEEESTVELDVTPGDPVLRLPTRRLVSVEEVRDNDTDAVIEASRYRVSRERGRIRRKSGCWPSGYARVAVDFTHGHTGCPDDLLGIVAHYARAARRDLSVQSVRVDDGSVSYMSGAAGELPPDALARYRIPEWSGMA